MYWQFLKPAPAFRDIADRRTVKEKVMIPWYTYFIGAGIYTAFAGWLMSDSPALAGFCLLSAPVGFFYAWSAWKKEQN